MINVCILAFYAKLLSLEFGINFVEFISEKFYTKEIDKCVLWASSMLVFGLNGIYDTTLDRIQSISRVLFQC